MRRNGHNNLPWLLPLNRSFPVRRRAFCNSRLDWGWMCSFQDSVYRIFFIVAVCTCDCPSRK